MNRRLRIAFCRISQETNALSPVRTEVEDFRRTHLLEGLELMRVCGRGVAEAPGFLRNAELSGFVRAARELGRDRVELVPLFSAWTISGGKLSARAQRWFCDKLEADLKALDGVPKTLPALLRAHRISEKASGVGFDWSEISGVRAKVDEELRELDQALADRDDEKIGEEFGDLLFALVNLGRFLPVGAEDALRAATAKFETRFRALERALAADDRSVHHTDAETLESYWAAVKGDPCS